MPGILDKSEDTKAHRLKDINLHINTKKGDLTKRADYCTVSFIVYASKTMLRVIQYRLPAVQSSFRKARDHKTSLPMHAGESKECQKDVSVCFADYNV